MAKKIAIISVLVLLLVGYFYFGLNHYLSFAFLKGKQVEIQNFQQQNQFLATSGFFALYVLVAALSVPGATLITLIGGAVFGLVTGSLLVSFASTLGATIAFLISRYLLRDSIQTRFPDKAFEINRGIEKDGAFYLFTLRLIPAFPFFIINLAMGLTRMKTRTFYWVSQIGMFPATLVYVNAGTQLSTLESATGILSPKLIFSFTLLGVFPLATKYLLKKFKDRTS